MTLCNGFYLLFCLITVNGSGKFTFQIHHGGKMKLVNDRLSYVENKVDFVDYMDMDRLSIVEIDGILIKDLGYYCGALYYVVPAYSDELVLLDSDQALMSIVGELIENTFEVLLYCEHPIQEGGSKLVPLLDQSQHDQGSTSPIEGSQVLESQLPESQPRAAQGPPQASPSQPQASQRPPQAEQSPPQA